jgi:hypothetical protein
LAVFDIEGFGRRTDAVQQRLRADLRTAVSAAFASVRLDVSTFQSHDTGDGLILRIPASVSKQDITTALTGALNTELIRRTMSPRPVEELRLRLALHAGEVGEDEHGIVGTDLNTVCRLVDAEVLRDVLRAADRSYLVVAASQTWYEAVIRHGFDPIDPAAYRPARLDRKEVHQTLWINVPSLTEPPGLPRYDPDAPAEGPRPRAAASGNGGRVVNSYGDQYGDTILGDKHVGVEHHGKGGVA